MMMAKIVKIVTKYFFGVGYTLLDDKRVLEVRSISSEVVEEGKEARRSYNPIILKSDLQEIDASALDQDILQKATKDVFYQEWMMNEEDVQPYLHQEDLVNIPLTQMKAFPPRPSVIQPAT